MSDSTVSGNSAGDGNGGGLYVFNAASAIRHSTVTGNSALNGAAEHLFSAARWRSITQFWRKFHHWLGPDLTGVIGTTFDVRFSLIGNNANSGLIATPPGRPMPTAI